MIEDKPAVGAALLPNYRYCPYCKAMVRIKDLSQHVRLHQRHGWISLQHLTPKDQEKA